MVKFYDDGKKEFAIIGSKGNPVQPWIVGVVVGYHIGIGRTQRLLWVLPLVLAVNTGLNIMVNDTYVLL
jgi:hypothetical protein